MSTRHVTCDLDGFAEQFVAHALAEAAGENLTLTSSLAYPDSVIDDDISRSSRLPEVVRNSSWDDINSFWASPAGYHSSLTLGVEKAQMPTWPLKDIGIEAWAAIHARFERQDARADAQATDVTTPVVAVIPASSRSSCQSSRNRLSCQSKGSVAVSNSSNSSKARTYSANFSSRYSSRSNETSGSSRSTIPLPCQRQQTRAISSSRSQTSSPRSCSRSVSSRDRSRSDRSSRTSRSKSSMSSRSSRSSCTSASRSSLSIASTSSRRSLSRSQRQTGNSVDKASLAVVDKQETVTQASPEEVPIVMAQAASNLGQVIGGEICPITQIGKNSATITAHTSIDVSKVLGWSQFLAWKDSIANESRIEVTKIHLQSVDKFGDNLESIKFTTDARVAGKAVPGIVFMRGGAVAILVILHNAGCQFTMVVRQARVPVCSGRFAEMLIGTFDEDGNFSGDVAKELKGEVGIQFKQDDLVDMTSLAFKGVYPGVFPTCGACDEFNRICLYQKTISAKDLSILNEKLTGLLAEDKMIKLQLIPFRALWRFSADAKALAAVCLYMKLDGAGLIPRVSLQTDSEKCRYTQTPSPPARHIENANQRLLVQSDVPRSLSLPHGSIHVSIPPPPQHRISVVEFHHVHQHIYRQECVEKTSRSISNHHSATSSKAPPAPPPNRYHPPQPPPSSHKDARLSAPQQRRASTPPHQSKVPYSCVAHFFQLAHADTRNALRVQPSSSSSAPTLPFLPSNPGDASIARPSTWLQDETQMEHGQHANSRRTASTHLPPLPSDSRNISKGRSSSMPPKRNFKRVRVGRQNPGAGLSRWDVRDLEKNWK